MNGTTPTTQDTPDKGRLQINLVSDITAYPIQGAQITISYTGVPETPLEQLTTDSSGQTDTIDLAAPPLEYSLNPENEIQPYSEYTMQITAEGFEPVSIAYAEILADVTAIQNVSMKPVDNPEDAEDVFRHSGSYIICRLSAQDTRRRDSADLRIRRDRLKPCRGPGIHRSS